MGKQWRRNLWLLFAVTMLLTAAGCRSADLQGSGDPSRDLTIPNERIPINQTICQVFPDETFWTQDERRPGRGDKLPTISDEAILPIQTMPPVLQER